MANLADVLVEIERSERICPQPQKWNELYRLLPTTQPRGARSYPAAPLILGAWWHTTPAEKQHRLREHIEWAEVNGAIDIVHEYLVSLSEDDWVHASEAPSGRVSSDSDGDE